MIKIFLNRNDLRKIPPMHNIILAKISELSGDLDLLSLQILYLNTPKHLRKN